MSLASAKVPAVLATGIICLVAGAGGAIGVMYSYGYRMGEPQRKSGDAAEPQAKGGRGGPGGMMGGGMMGGGGMRKGGGGPNAKNQLAALVVKLDTLANTPLMIKFDEKQHNGIREHLAGLGQLETLEEEDAQKRLDALLELFKDQRATLEAIGYRWPGGGGGGFRMQAPAPNPFKEGDNAEHLKSLLGKDT